MIQFLTVFRDFKIRHCNNEPDHNDFSYILDQYGKYTPYGNPKKDIPHDVPKFYGEQIVLFHCFDANLMHNILSGKLVTSVIHF